MPLHKKASKLWNKEVKPFIHDTFHGKSSSSSDDETAPPPVEEAHPPPPPPLLQEAAPIPVDPTPVDTFVPEHVSPPFPIQRTHSVHSIMPIMEETLCEFKEADFCDTFSITNIAGYGSCGIVYHRQHPSYGRVAIKQLKDDFGDKFRIREIRTALIRHPGIITFYGFLYQDIPFRKMTGFVMEYMETDLAKVIRDPKYLYSLLQVVDWVIGLAATVAEMHRRNVVHRDIKSANILVHYNEKTNSLGREKLCDFGISREISSTNALTKTYKIGTPYYMAPEIHRNKEQPPIPYNEKVDVYSLGVVLWELLHRTIINDAFSKSSNTTQFDSESNAIELSEFLDLKPIFEISGELIEAVRNIMNSCMALNPNFRPTMTELKDQLESLRSNL